MSPRLRDDPAALGSLYLRQHLDNPVAWWAWGEDALAEARRLDRPVFLSVGYAACHWCHVMAHESFEDPGVAAVLNERFVPIKVDREERPDVDALYMAAVQLSSGHGGWPMSVFALPDGRPFLAGTYYPPRDRGGLVGFSRLLAAVAEAWDEQRPLVTAQADELAGALEREVRLIDYLGPATRPLDLAEARRNLREALVERADADGGFGPAPRFPRPSYLRALFEFDDGPSRAVLSDALEAMARRGLYDHLDGGFARYCVDATWRVPHFEKMLSDQALLARCYLEAARVTGRASWREVGLATLDFVERALRTPSGYAAALDADAGGVEGGHVTWTPEEVRLALAGEPAAVVDAVLRRYTITAAGDLEGRSVPRLSGGEPFSTPPHLREALRRLAEARERRVQPARDDKVVLEWNAYFAQALLAAGSEPYLSRALELLGGLGATHHAGGRWWRTQHRRVAATAGDLAALADAHLDAFVATGDDRWRDRARALAETLLERHWEGPRPHSLAPDVGDGVATPDRETHDLVTRPKDVLDGATPSAHALATRALARLALVDADPDRLVVAQRLVTLGAALFEHPLAVPDLVEAAGFALQGVEVAVPGAEGPLARHLRSKVVPRTVVITGEGGSPLLSGRLPGLAYVCRAGVCSAPVDHPAALDAALDEALAWR
ncbi:MAG TPA: DUF255 domain-containing protein [Acidimicrobiales bacterium]|nr:DUF255 domain-containing protein [Acidimicrobiales bacterium]